MGLLFGGGGRDSKNVAAGEGKGDLTETMTTPTSSTTTSSSTPSTLSSSPQEPPSSPPSPKSPLDVLLHLPSTLSDAAATSVEEAKHHAHLALRTADFWRRATGIYVAYKGKQAQEAALLSGSRVGASLLRLPLLPEKVKERIAEASRPWDDERLKEELWRPHHEWAGREMYDLAVSVRGFYLKVSRREWLREREGKRGRGREGGGREARSEAREGKEGEENRVRKSKDVKGEKERRARERKAREARERQRQRQREKARGKKRRRESAAARAMKKGRDWDEERERENENANAAKSRARTEEQENEREREREQRSDKK